MKNRTYLLPLAILLILFTISTNTSHSQTEGFNVETPIQKIAGSTSDFLKDIIEESKREPKKSIRQSLVCNSSCFLVIPDIEIVSGRGDFTGTGLLGCRASNTEKFTEPLFYRINNLRSFNEGGGGLVILVTDKEAMKKVLGDNLHLASDNTGAGQIGDLADKNIKPLITYSKYKGEGLAGIDLTGSILEYSSKDTFDAYQRTVVPIEIFMSPQDVPPLLRDFRSLLMEWTKDCK